MVLEYFSRMVVKGVKPLNAGWPADPRTSPYARRGRETSSHLLSGTRPPSLHFAGQVRDGLAHIDIS